MTRPAGPPPFGERLRSDLSTPAIGRLWLVLGVVAMRAPERSLLTSWRRWQDKRHGAAEISFGSDRMDLSTEPSKESLGYGIGLDR
jgi:hypothetical protein